MCSLGWGHDHGTGELSLDDATTRSPSAAAAGVWCSCPPQHPYEGTRLMWMVMVGDAGFIPSTLCLVPVTSGLQWGSWTVA